MPEIPPPALTPNFTEEESGTYFYVAAISDADQEKGRAAGDVIGYRYLGKNDKKQHVLALVSQNGQVSSKAYCSEPCAIIKYDSGERIAYNPSSIIGAAFQDAINGLLKDVSTKVENLADKSITAIKTEEAESGAFVPSSESAPWVGRYVGSFEGGADGDLNISAARNGRFSISLSIGVPSGCVGEISGSAKLNEKFLSLIKQRDDSGHQCQLSLFRRGDRIDISEEGCAYFHGFECSFNGQARRR